MARDGSLIQAVELWSPQGEVMALSAGAYAGNRELSADSVERSFHFGEGLPGAVWASRQALLWKQLVGPFVRANLVSQAGIEAALGFPLSDGDRLMGVVTLLLAPRSPAPACFEIWDVVEELGVLKFGHGYYSHCQEFERFSPFIQFQRGTGLPGLTWSTGQVQVMDDVRKSSSFIRAGLAANCGLTHGLGIPIHRNRSVVQALALFGAEGHSLVRGAELYYPQGAELGAATVFDWTGRGASHGESVADAPNRSLAESVVATGLPALSEGKPSANYPIAIALPIRDRKGLKQVLVLSF
jgi:hypothetical protein